MAERLDVAGRLAEGLPALEHMQTYVRACQQIGYRDPDLTGDPAQIHDWYAGEEGLDLHALDTDCVALRAAGSAITEALRLQRDQLAVLATAWTGPGADSAAAFLRRHCDNAGTVVSEVRAAAQRCESLRDNLWHLVDAKVATTTAIDDRTLAQRPAWLSAAAAVTTDASARDVVDQQIKPYVDNDIRHDWRTSMLSTRTGITAAYDMVIDRFAASQRAYFEVPADFGSLSPPPRALAAAFPAGARVTPFSGSPAGAVPSASAPAPLAAPAPQAASQPLPASPPSDSGWGGTSGMPGGASGMPGDAGGLGSAGDPGGLGGLAGRIVAAMGDVLGSAGSRPADDLFDDPAHDRHEPDPLDEPEEPDEPEPAHRATDEAVPASQPIGQAGPATGAPGTPTPLSAAPPTEPPAPVPVADTPPKPKPAGATPCEIAANELPQAGQ